MTSAAQRRERLAGARLYLVTDAAIPDAALDAALAGGVDMVQLRDPALGDEELVQAARRLRAACDRHGALLWVNDRPDLAARAEADGVHVGQDDAPVAEARRAGDGELLVGLSTHAPDQLETGIAAGADQLSVGPVWETPTKPGRPAAGLAYIRHAARRRPPVPWFAIGGIDAGRIDQVVAAGAQRCVVVRAIRDAEDPGAAAAALSDALEGRPLGAATDRERRRPVANGPAAERGGGDTARGYARGRARDEAARAALVPLAEGERPPAVTVGALLAGALASAEIVSFVLGYSPGEEGRVARSVILVSLLSAIAVGMWRASYWAVLGMQALLGLTIVLAALGAVFAMNLTAVILVIAITLPASVLFWFLVKSMARLQMPREPEVRD